MPNNATDEEIWIATNGLLELGVHFKSLDTISIKETKQTTVEVSYNSIRPRTEC